MSKRARLDEAGPRVRLPERAPNDREVVHSAAALPGPVRTCVGCRSRGQRSVLLRVVAVSEGEKHLLLVDVRRARPGRGAWLHPDLTCLDLAERRRAFPRALRTGALDLTAVRDHLMAVTADG